MATATEVYDTSRYGTYFVIPVGTNTTPTIQSFSYSSLHIIAAEDSTVVHGGHERRRDHGRHQHAKRGRIHVCERRVWAGATVTASKPVEVHELTGRIGSNYQSRTFAIRPVSQWDTSYYAPVGTTSSSYVHDVFVFNPYADQHHGAVLRTRTNYSSFTVTNRTLQVPDAAEFGSPLLHDQWGRLLRGRLQRQRQLDPREQPGSYDWGYALLPAAALTPVVIVGWAPGSDFDRQRQWQPGLGNAHQGHHHLRQLLRRLQHGAVDRAERQPLQHELCTSGLSVPDDL